MIWKLIGGIFLALLSIVILIFWIDYHRREIEIGCVGVISDIHHEQIIVDYKINGKSYSAPFDCKIYARVGEMPSIGLKVMVIVEPDAPEEIYVKFSRGNRNGNQYVNYDPNKEFRAQVGGILLLFLSGVYYIFEALGWI